MCGVTVLLAFVRGPLWRVCRQTCRRVSVGRFFTDFVDLLVEGCAFVLLREEVRRVRNRRYLQLRVREFRLRALGSDDLVSLESLRAVGLCVFPHFGQLSGVLWLRYTLGERADVQCTVRVVLCAAGAQLGAVLRHRGCFVSETDDVVVTLFKWADVSDEILGNLVRFAAGVQAGNFADGALSFFCDFALIFLGWYQSADLEVLSRFGAILGVGRGRPQMAFGRHLGAVERMVEVAR